MAPIGGGCLHAALRGLAALHLRGAAGGAPDSAEAGRLPSLAARHRSAEAAHRLGLSQYLAGWGGGGAVGAAAALAAAAARFRDAAKAGHPAAYISRRGESLYPHIDPRIIAKAGHLEAQAGGE